MLLTIDLLLVLLVGEAATSNLSCFHSDGKSFSSLSQITVGDICCPQTQLVAPYKENRVDVGIAGSMIDPQIGALKEELNKQFFSNKTGCVPQPISPRPVAGKRIEL